MASGGAAVGGATGSGAAGSGMAGGGEAPGGSPGAGSGAGGGGGGGAAGGKMKSRRHLLGAAKPPYARSKKQGIISRMTETVKNIVPAWLQKYFSKREDEYVDANESANQEETPVNYHRDYTDEDTIIDKRLTPEPARINREEPSTSRSALNFSVALTRPALHRSHLNYTVLDSSVPPCQPSTSSIFGIGSPGLSFIKEIKDSTSQQDDDNISTTSGFSSRASDKDVAVLKNTSSSLLWATEAERTHSVSQHSAASSKKPAFSLSVFEGLYPARGSTSDCKKNQLGFSPFYPGKTAYGGAAVKSKQIHIQPYRVQMKAKAKQGNGRPRATLSTAAQCILAAMENLSTPLEDAKRIPPPLPLYRPLDLDELGIPDYQSKRRKLESQNASQLPPVKKLVIPQVNRQPMHQVRYFKPSSTSTTESSKICQRVDTKYQEMTEKTLPAEQQAEPSESNVTSYKLSTAASNGLSSGMNSGGGKMRRERGMHYLSRAVQEQEVEEPVLPKIPLPIGTASLPQFNFSFVGSTAVSASPSAVSTAATSMIQPTSNVSSPAFAFSSPIVKSTEAEVLPTSSQIGFTFSVPVVKSAELSGSSDTPVTSFLTLDTTNSTNINKGKEEIEEYFDGPFKTGNILLKEGSVLDILKNPDFGFLKTNSSTSAQPTTSTVVYTRPAITNFSAGKETSKQASYWQSDTCDPSLQNKDIDNKCVTCQATKASTVESTKQTISSSQCDTSKPTAPPAGMLGFGDKFKTVPGTWDCDTCLVQNKPEATKCIACETPKPGTGVMPALTLPVVADSSVTVTSSSSSTDTTVTLGFGDKFKKPKGSWDCTVCLVSNKTEDNKCVACQSEKPEGPTPVTSSSASAFSAPSGEFLDLDKFKKPEGSWDCETCLVQNKAEATKCVACESAKPGTKAELKGFGTATASTNTALPSFTFGVQSSSSSESSHTSDSTGSFKFGEQGGFKFGIASESASSNSVVGGFKFPSTPGDFKFGVSSSLSKSEESKKEGKNNSFTFGLPSTSSQAPSTFRFGAASLGQQEKKEEPVLGGFAFGTSSATSMVANENKTGVSGFTFGTVGEKEVVLSSFAFKKPDEKKDEAPSTKGGFSFGSAESAAASQFVLGRTEEKQDSVTSAAPLVFGKKADTEEPKAQPIFSVGKSEHTKEESTAKPIFNFSFVKPSEKEPEQAKPAFSFGVQTSTSDQGAPKPSFSFLSSGSSSTAIPTTSANSSSVFGSVSSSSNPTPVPAPFVFGQASNTVSSSTFGNSAESTTSQSFGFSQENKPATTSSSTGVAVAPFVFGSGGSSSNAANPGFTFGATTTSSSTGLSSSFVFGSGSSAPAAGPAFGASQPPAFGQSQGSSQPNTPSFGSLSTTLFSAGSQPAPPAFGSVTSSTQPPVFGQQASQQPGFGSGTSSAGPVFQFGSNTSNFNFPNNPGVFTFGANPTAPTASAQPSGSSGFSFSQPPAFTVGTNGKNIFSASGSSVSGRKIKTAVRRRK
ncbi:nuclear pore complex protein Nup153 [Oxyura jamaicensis]|uniref:nuclear pore complex protein Nup153 n=1 Tax=Oxyura jamaicensis TaxID=8884 RepID=UPI0015A5A2F3|nr:nuclear pore complex protein Nup153 [Oxyura jamaicensis]